MGGHLTNPGLHRLKPLFIKAFSIILPVLILIVIFRQINVQQMMNVLKSANPFFFFSGLVVSPLVICTGAFRWQLVLTYYIKQKVSYGFVVSHYWIGLTVGRFFPGAVTWDLYRITIANKKFGHLGMQVYSLLLEKLAALIAAGLLAAGLYCIVTQQITPGVFENRLTGLIHENLGTLDNRDIWLPAAVSCLFVCLSAWIGYKWLKARNIDGYQLLIKPLFNPGLTLQLLFSSLGIYLFMAVFNHLFFYALNSPVPFLVHFFLMPILAILLMLPVSIGGLGVREGFFIVFYGLFGVDMEIALAAALMNLTVSLLYSGIGGIFILLKGHTAS